MPPYYPNHLDTKSSKLVDASVIENTLCSFQCHQQLAANTCGTCRKLMCSAAGSGAELDAMKAAQSDTTAGHMLICAKANKNTNKAVAETTDAIRQHMQCVAGENAYWTAHAMQQHHNW